MCYFVLSARCVDKASYVCPDDTVDISDALITSPNHIYDVQMTTASPAQGPPPQVIYLVRHAEKPVVTNGTTYNGVDVTGTANPDCLIPSAPRCCPTRTRPGCMRATSPPAPTRGSRPAISARHQRARPGQLAEVRLRLAERCAARLEGVPRAEVVESANQGGTMLAAQGGRADDPQLRRGPDRSPGAAAETREGG